MYCPKCGTENSDQAQFCAKCGARLKATAAATPQPAAPVAVATPERLSKGVYFWLPLGLEAGGLLMCLIGILVVIAGGAVSLGLGVPAAMAAAGPFVLLGMAAFIAAMVFMLVAWYKAWKSIQDGFARTTPGKAVGFLFIPFYNFYWVFVSYWGLAQDYNKYTERHNLNLPKLPEGLFLTQSIVTVSSVVASWIPGVNFLVMLGAPVLTMFVLYHVVEGTNRLADARGVPAK